jgi:heat shock protein HslJ
MQMAYNGRRATAALLRQAQRGSVWLEIWAASTYAWIRIVVGRPLGNVVSVRNDTEITASFGIDGWLACFAGCNNFGATYETDGKQPFKIGPIAVTEGACAQPQGVMEQETQSLTALQSAASYHFNGPRLEMRTAAGALAATLQQAPSMSRYRFVGRWAQDSKPVTNRGTWSL